MHLPEIKIEITANMVAWYAAIVATIGIAINLMNFLRDRPRITIKYKIGWRIINACLSYKEKTDYVGIDVINNGRRPVVIDKVGYLAFSGKNGIASEPFITGPRTLDENRSTSYLIEQKLVNLKDVKYFYAYTQTGKMYKKKYVRSRN